MYTFKDWKDGKVAIDYTKNPEAAKLHGIIKSAYPNCIDLPAGISDIYWSTGRGWDSSLYEEWKEDIPLVEVNDIQLTAPAKK